LPSPACNLPATRRLDAPGADDDLLDCLACQVDEAALAVGRDLFGANLCCTAEGCRFVRTRASCRRIGGIPGYYENRPFAIQSSPQPSGPHGLDVGADGALYVVSSDSVIRIEDPSGDSVVGTNIATPSYGATATGAAVDPDGNVYIATRCDSVILEVMPSGAETSVAGMTGFAGHSADGTPAVDARIAAANRVA
jgi:hypothetical protein